MRPEAPLVYTPEQQCAIVAMASKKPEKYGIQLAKLIHCEQSILALRQGIDGLFMI